MARRRKAKISATTKAVAIALPLLLFAVAALLTLSKDDSTNGIVPPNTAFPTETENSTNTGTKNETTDSTATTQAVALYFIDQTSTTLALEQIQIPIDSTKTEDERNQQLVADVAVRLKEGPKSTNLLPSIPENVTIKRVNLPGDMKAEIFMSEEYLNLSDKQELLLRTSLINTFTGLEFISAVKIFAGNTELSDTNGPLGYITAEGTMVNTPIDAADSAYEQTFKLYFSDYDLLNLTVEERVVKVNPNQKLERVIVEQIIKGPQKANIFATVPPETKINEISTKDTVCYLDLSSEFITKHQSGSTSDILAAYSIVNSLTELPDIKKVQFLIDGKKQSGFEHFDLSKPIERDLDV